MVNYNLLSQISREKTPQKQTVFLDSPEHELCILHNVQSKEKASTHTSLLQTDLDSTASKTSSKFTFVLPRQSEKYSTCGDIKSIQKTLEDNCTDIIKYHCDRFECPSDYCADTLTHRQADKAAERHIELSRLLYIERGDKTGYTKHIIISPSKDYAISKYSTPEGYKSLHSEAIEKSKYAGIRGGSITTHDYRIKGESIDCDDDLDIPKSYTDKGIVYHLKKTGYGIGKHGKGSLWDGIFHDALGLGSAYEYVELSPHFHVHGHGHLMNSRNFYNETGWIYKNKGTRKDKKSLSASIQYTLTHATRLEVLGIATTRTLSWFGDMAYNAGGLVEIKGGYVPKTCSHGYQYYEAGLNDTSQLFDAIYVREVTRYYRLTTKVKPPPDDFNEVLDALIEGFTGHTYEDL